MNRSELAPLIDTLIPGFYSFAYALIPDELQAEQLVIDAYSVFLIREEGSLRELSDLRELRSGSKGKAKDSSRDRNKLRHFLQKHIITDIFELGQTRAPQLKSLLRESAERSAFYQLETSQRAALHLKEHMNFSYQDMEEVFAMKKYQIIELLHNSREALGGSNSFEALGLKSKAERGKRKEIEQ